MNRPGCLHPFVGARLPANALVQSMHQGLAKSTSRASALLQAINCAPECQPGALLSGVLMGRLGQWQTWIVIVIVTGCLLRRWHEPSRLPSHLCRSALARECAG